MTVYHLGESFTFTSPFIQARTLMGKTQPHRGVDFAAEQGTPIPAAGNGKVVLKKFDKGGYGHYLILEHRNPDGEFIHTLYAHLMTASGLNVGERVTKGVTVGLVGSTGRSTGPHLHFEVHRHRKSGLPLSKPREEVDPLTFDVSGLQYPDEVNEATQAKVKNETVGACCLPITQSDGSEFKDAKDLAVLLGDESNYLLGLNTWHGGIHISDEKAPWVKDIHPIRCMADGEVIAFRMMPDYLVSKYKEKEYRYSNSFCLVRHKFKQAKPADGTKDTTLKESNSDQGMKEEEGFTYYTLYMHLCPWGNWPKNNRYRLKKGWRVRHSVPTHDYQPPTLTLNAGEEFELVEGTTSRRGYVIGQGEFEFFRIKVLSNGASSKEVLATKGMDSLWMAQDPSAIEKVGNIVRPMWVYDKIEARVKEEMVGRADPKTQKGKTGHYVAGDRVFSVPAGSLISFDAHRCEWHEVHGRARRMARCVVQPLGRPVWLCVEEENIDIKRQEPTHLGKLYELPTPVPIRAGETIGYLGLYEAPTSTDGGISSKHMVHIELFSDDPRAEKLISSKEWKDKGFVLIDGSDSDGALDPAKIPPFFLNLYRHASDDKELKDNELTVKKLENAVDSIENYHRVKGMVVKHSSEWWSPASKVMMEQFKSIFCNVTELSPLIEHEVKRVQELGWMDRLSKVHIAGPTLWHFYPLALNVTSTRSDHKLIWMKRVIQLYGEQIGEAFRDKVISVGNELGIDPNYIMACMALETVTRFDPSITNPNSSATGLIQFMRDTAADLGTTVEKLAQMSHVEQMEYVKKYFEYMAKLFGVPTNTWSLEDVYFSIFTPKLLQMDDDAILYSSPQRKYIVNAVHDVNKDGRITKSEIAHNIRVYYKRGERYEG